MSDSAAPLAWRRSAISGTEETTRGTEVAVTAALSGTAVYNSTFEPEIFGENERRPYAEGSGTIFEPAGARRSRFTIVQQIHPSDQFLPMLTMAGFVNSAGTYGPTANQASRKCWTLAAFEDGRKKIIYGAAANCTIDFEVGKAVMATWEGSGIWKNVADVSLPSDSLPTSSPYMGLSATITLGGAEVATMPRCQINLGANVVYVGDMTSADGAKFAYVQDFTPRVTTELDARLVATLDHYGILEAGTPAALIIAVTNGSNTLTFTAAAAQRRAIRDGQEDNRRKDIIEFGLNFNTSTDNWLTAVQS